jgi:hypothetical protein
LRVLVVNEPELATAIERLRGEWAERSGGELSTVAKTWPEVAAGQAMDADVVVFPARYLGELCTRNWLRPVRPSVLESEEFNAADIFPLVRNELMKWGGQTMALPLGVDQGALGETSAEHPGLALLTAVAAATVNEHRESVLFDADSMKARLTEPAFVEALGKLVGSQNKSAGAGDADLAQSVPLLGYDGVLVSVTAASRNAASAFKLAAWLTSPETGSQLAAGRERMLPARRSQAAAAVWQKTTATAADRAVLAKRLETALRGQQCLLVPRIPRVDEYMAALDDAVKSATGDKVSPEAALQTAARRWDSITEAAGREAQRAAYQKHLGIEPL